MEFVDRLERRPVREFVESVLAGYETDRIEWFKLLVLPKRPWSYHCDYPVRERPRARSFRRGYRMRASVNPNVRLPWSEEIYLGTRPDPTRDPDTPPETITREVAFATVEDLAVFTAGCCLFRFLRHSRQVPGLNNGSRARRHGLYALAAFRTGLPFDPFDATDRLVARDRLLEAGQTRTAELLAPYE